MGIGECVVTLLCIREAQVACHNLDEAVAFHASALGFAEVEHGDGWALLAMAGAPSGRLRLIEVPGAAPEPMPQVWDVGPRLLGIYSRDLAATSAGLIAGGGTCGSFVTYPYKDRTMTEVLGYGRDGVWWTVPQAIPGLHRPSDALTTSDSVHSELHSAVLVVDDHGAALDFFLAGGMEIIFDGYMSGPTFRDLGVPEGASMRLAFLTGPGHLPARLEIMSFVGAPRTDRSGDRLGLKKLVFACDDAEATRAALVDAGAQQLEDGELLGPVGIRLQLVDSAAE